MERGEMKAVGRQLMEDGVELAKEALTHHAGRRRREIVAESANHFMAAMGIAALIGHNPFEEETDA